MIKIPVAVREGVLSCKVFLYNFKVKDAEHIYFSKIYFQN